MSKTAAPKVVPESLATRAGLTIPAALAVPNEEPVSSFKVGPYITFAHPQRADEWAKLLGRFGHVDEGHMYLVNGEEFVKLDVAKLAVFRYKQYWKHTDDDGNVVDVQYTPQPKPYREYMETVCFLYLPDRLLPVTVRFRTTKCSGALQMTRALQMAATEQWAKQGAAYNATMALQQPALRYVAECRLSKPRASRQSKYTYTKLTAVVRPTTQAEWDLAKAFSADEKAQQQLEHAANYFQWATSNLEQTGDVE